MIITKKRKTTKQYRKNIMGRIQNKISRKISRKMKKRKNNNITKHTKKMVCSPYVANKTPDETTCYTNQIIFKIRDAFNKQHDNAKIKITSSNPMVVLKELQTKMSDKCTKEDCWLSLLSFAEKDMLEKTVFAPKQPMEWEQNPTEWLSNHDILNVLTQYEKSNPNFKFIGPTPIDFDVKPDITSDKCVTEELCKFSLKTLVDSGIKKIGIIFNLDKHDKGGSHWVSMFIDIEKSFIFYFDSAANNTPNEINEFVKRVQHQINEVFNKQFEYYENYPKQHQRSNTECGMYSLYFIITMGCFTPDGEESQIGNNIDFFKNKRIPDAKMIELRNKYFNAPS
jgi:hypothetical protein